MDNSKDKRAQAEEKFEKAKKKAAEGTAAMLEYQVGLDSQRIKTEKLKALRLARDAATPAPEPVVKKRKTAAKG